MFLRTVDMLAQQTQAYWELSSIVQGTLDKKVTVAKALEQINDLEFNLGPQRYLLKRVKTLGNVLIEGKAKPRKPKLIAAIHHLVLASKTGA